MKDHINILGILWIVFGALRLFAALFILLLFFGITLIPGVDFAAGGILKVIGVIIGAYLGLLGLPKIIGGIGLLNGREWGRVIVIIMSFLSLVNIPVGTALGVYSLIVLFNRESIEYFRSGPQV
jgi:hypothetical protein